MRDGHGSPAPACPCGLRAVRRPVRVRCVLGAAVARAGAATGGRAGGKRAHAASGVGGSEPVRWRCERWRHGECAVARHHPRGTLDWQRGHPRGRWQCAEVLSGERRADAGRDGEGDPRKNGGAVGPGGGARVAVTGLCRAGGHGRRRTGEGNAGAERAAEPAAASLTRIPAAAGTAAAGTDWTSGTAAGGSARAAGGAQAQAQSALPPQQASQGAGQAAGPSALGRTGAGGEQPAVPGSRAGRNPRRPRYQED